MSIETVKIELIQKVLLIDDKKVLDSLSAILDTPVDENPELAAAIREGLDDIHAGRVKPHAEARLIYERWLQK